jgi:hypothetical protein
VTIGGCARAELIIEAQKKLFVALRLPIAKVSELGQAELLLQLLGSERFADAGFDRSANRAFIAREVNLNPPCENLPTIRERAMLAWRTTP